MQQFLRETWQIWYWAYFHPSRLQAWVDGITGDKEGWSSRLRSISRRAFGLRFSLLALLLLSPLLTLVAWQGQSLDWLIVLTALLCLYGLSLFSFAISLTSPWLFLIVYLTHPEPLRQAWRYSTSILPPLPQLALGVSIYTLGLVASSLLAYWLWQRQQWQLGRITLVIGLSLSVGVGIWLAADLFWFSGLLTLLAMGISALFVRDELKPNDFDRTIGVKFEVVFGVVFGIAVGLVFGVMSGIAVGVAGIAAFGVAIDVAFVVAVVVAVAVAGIAVFGVAGVVAVVMVFGVASGVVVGVLGVVGFGVAVVVAGGIVGGVIALSSLGLPWLLLVSWLLGLALAVWPWRWAGVVVAGILGVLGWDAHGVGVGLVAVAALLGYYRIFPFYLGQALLIGAAGHPAISGLRRIRLNISLDPVAFLHRLPPHSSEILYLPLPGHAYLLRAAFAVDPKQGIAIADSMRTSPYYGLRTTFKQSLPLLVATEFVRVTNCAEVVACIQPDHPRLPQLIPSLYPQLDSTSAPVLAEPLDTVSAQIIPALVAIAKSLAAASEQGNLTLQARSLERLVNRIDQLAHQLRSLPSSQSSPLWAKVIESWRNLIDTERQALERQAQGEIVAAFQVGNPVGRERADLFKGREQERNTIYRLLLDRGRPTVVVHGPRRFGKSSFLLQLPRLLPIDVCYAFETAQNSAFRENNSGFCFGLARALERDGKADGLNLPKPDRDKFRSEPFGMLDDYLDLVEQRLGERFLLIAIDEFELIGSALHKGTLSSEVLDYLRTMIQHRSRIALIFGGVNTLEELGPNWTSYFINVQPLEILYLEPQSARELLENPDPQYNLRYAAGVVEQILVETRCQPYLLQALGAAMVNLANRDGLREFPLERVPAAIAEAFQLGAIYFRELWNNYTGTNPAEVRCGRAIMRTLAAGAQPTPPSDPAELEIYQKALARLLRYHTAERTSIGYRIEVPLVAQWVRERAIDD